MSNSDYIGIVNDVFQGIVAIGAFIAIWVTLGINRRQSQENQKLLQKQIEASDEQLKKQLAASYKQQKEQLEASDRQLKEQLAASEAQINKQIEEGRRLAMEDRQHQSRPIIVPSKAIFQTSATSMDMHTKQVTGERVYTSEKKINWSYSYPIGIELHNMGNGPAFNMHVLLSGSEDICQSQFVSWDNGPIAEKSTIKVYPAHSQELRLFHNNSVNGKHPLYDQSLDSPSNPWIYRIACLTITYHDLFGKKYVSIFNYTLQHQWVHVVTEEITGTPSFDLKELNQQRKGPKLSAPPVKTR